MILAHTPNAGNFTATLKAESGTIAYLSDVSSIYSLDGTLSSNRVMTMAGNSLSFTGGNVLFETGDSSFPILLHLAGTSPESRSTNYRDCV